MKKIGYQWNSSPGGCTSVLAKALLLPVVGALALTLGACGGSGPGSDEGKTVGKGSSSLQSPKPKHHKHHHHSATPTPAPTHAKPKPEKKIVLTESGSGIKNTAEFRTHDNWDLKYSFDCSNFGSQGNFQVYENYPTGDVLTNDLAKSKSETTHQYDDPGTHHLKVNSECNWKIKVIDKP